MLITSRFSLPGWLAWLVAGGCSVVVAPVAAAPLDPLRLDAQAIAPHRLAPQQMAELRGGLRVGDQFQVTFGIERAIVVDGVLQASSKFQWFSGLQPPTTQSPVAATMNGVSPLQIAAVANAAGNAPLASVNTGGLVISTGLAHGNPVTVIQNATNNRVIQSINQINVDVSSLSLFREMRMMELLQRNLR